MSSLVLTSHQAGYCGPLLCFRRWFLPCPQTMVCFRLHSLSTGGLLLLHSGKYTKSQQPNRGKGRVSHLRLAYRPVESVGWYQAWYSQRLMGGCLAEYSQQEASPLSASFQISSLPPVMEVPPQYSWCCWKEVVFSSCVLNTAIARQSLTALLFLCRRGQCC